MELLYKIDLGIYFFAAMFLAAVIIGLWMYIDERKEQLNKKKKFPRREFKVDWDRYIPVP